MNTIHSGKPTEPHPHVFNLGTTSISIKLTKVLNTSISSSSFPEK